MLGTRSVTSMSAVMAALGMIALSGAAIAQEKMKMSEAQCESIWHKANPGNKAKISESEAKAYISDINAVNKDKDGTIERAEFMRACDMGLVKSTATTGGSSGTGESSSGSSHDKDRSYDNKK